MLLYTYLSLEEPLPTADSLLRRPILGRPPLLRVAELAPRDQLARPLLGGMAVPVGLVSLDGGADLVRNLPVKLR